ncbi:capsular exopolysaccharide synthesis family protein [Jejuia pallidilutea]|uniref:non-specific protein-tyrosine kinase n=1 Tax=Jejuia pallidilutea TaxID=504487 RepID=A0A362WZ63_9FLAO|nr:polysaccharide biosynthesis tyrosine autokinase [Jejuia pallidilutea]PQV47710.1 capsular exopolysaccharide synthesis family protein [Jejuia pallidilutea]
MLGNQNKNQGDFNLKKHITTYTRHWIWFILSCIICFTLAFFKLRYTTPEYNAYAKIMILDEENSSAPANNVLKDLKKFSGGNNTKVEDEIEVLKSRSLMESVVKKLDLNIQYSIEGRFHNTQFFPNSKSPIKINFIESDSIVYSSKLSINLEIISNTDFNYNFKKDEPLQKGSFGRSIDSSIGSLVVTPREKDISAYIGQRIFVNINPTYKIAEWYSGKVAVAQAAEFSKIINLSLNDASPLKAKMVIDTLIAEYNRMSIREKNKKAKNTADFIDERVNLIASDLSEADDKIEQFKTGNKLTNIVSEADLYIKSNAQAERDLDAKRTELNKLNYVKNIIDEDDSSFSRIPENIGFENNSTNLTAQKYNELLGDRDRLLKSSNEKNPVIVNLDQQLENLKNSLRQSIDNSYKSISFEIRSLENTSSKLNSKIFAVPGQVRKSRDIEREQATKESLYLYLLEKREEAAISLTSTSPNAQIIDNAYGSGMPVSPKKSIVYLASIILGLLIPFGIIYTKDFLDNKVHNKEDLVNTLQGITVLGEIPRLTKRDKLLIEKNDRSILSESFRIIRTNADYIRKGRKVENYNNVIFVTSTINGEGKSFFSMNMALTMANTGKKVLVIGADVRNPQIFPAIKKALNTKEIKNGLTEFLVDDTINVKDVVNTHLINDIKVDVLLSGKVPPNPAELLMGDRVKELFDNVSQEYDYVIVDTAPSMLVTDTILISQYAGHTIYLTRANYTEKEILNFAKELHDDKKLNGMMLVVNDVKQSNFGYGAKYGYYGTPPKKRWFSFGKS